MARDIKTAGKSETLTIRLDPKMRFALEFVARLRGQNITTVVERAIKRSADDQRTEFRDHEGNNWLDYWHVSEGIRAIKLALDPDTHPSFSEEEIADFVRVHWPFFSDNAVMTKLRQESVDIIWPHLQSLLVQWRNTKAVKRLEAGERMQEILRAAQAVFVPAWPQPDKNSKYNKNDEAVDDVPF